MLKFSPGSDNAKLRKLEAKTGKKIYSFSIRSGHNCPNAKECKSSAVEDGAGKRHIEDGEFTKFRCFSASQEVLWSGVYNQRKDNEIILEIAAQDVYRAADTIISSLPKKAEIIRIHIGGDFKTFNYFRAWMIAARYSPKVQFYAYTKQLPFWIKAKNCPQDGFFIPPNMSLTASYGGHSDHLIAKHGLKSAIVVNSEYQARKLGLVVDHNDYHALVGERSFALVIHGSQPKGSDAGKAWQRIKKGLYGKSSVD